MSTPEESALPPSAELLSADQSEPSQQPELLLRRLWELFIAFAIWIVSVLLLFLPQVLALPYVVYRYRGMHPTQDVLLADKTLIVLLLLGIFPAHLLTLLIAWAVVTRFGKVSAIEGLRFQWSSRISILKSVGLAIGLFVLTWIVTLTFRGEQTSLEKIIRSSRPAALIIAFLAVATAPLVEEVIYRGILFPAWQRLTGSAIAVIVVTLMFAIPHVPQYWPNLAVISSITMLSLALTIVRARTGRLLPCYVIHLVFNGIQAMIILLEPLIRRFLETPQTNPTPTLLHLLIKNF